MGIKLIKIACVYLFVGLISGMAMSISHNFTLSSFHSHVLLVGWEIFALAGIIYTIFPKITENKLAKLHFWINNIALPIFCLGVFLIDFRANEAAPAHEAFIPIAAVGGALTTIALILFIINIFLNLKDTAAKK